ncbi:MAG: HNH endonuclease [Armatimonadetes bacterium]|nr:HNH endonuclease [Armatimonadota bacterium]
MTTTSISDRLTTAEAYARFGSVPGVMWDTLRQRWNVRLQLNRRWHRNGTFRLEQFDLAVQAAKELAERLGVTPAVYRRGTPAPAHKRPIGTGSRFVVANGVASTTLPNDRVMTIDPDLVPIMSKVAWIIDGGGYAMGWLKGTHIKAHELALLGGPAGDGNHIDHLDGNRLNNIRANLEVVTPAENTRRMLARRLSSPHRDPNPKLAARMLEAPF